MIKALIFDIGGVFIIPDIFEGVFADFAVAIGVPPEKIVAMNDKYLDRMLVGKISGDEYFALIKKKFGIKKDIKKIWVDVAIKKVRPNKELLKMTDGLRSRYPLIALSNVSGTRGIIDKKLGIYKHFDKVFLSHKIKMKKPSKQAYRYVLKKLKLKPDEVIFIDDRESNLKPARELGIKCIQFNNNAQLLTEFKRLGLV